MNAIYKLLTVLTILLTLSACHQEEISPFTGQPGVNFMGRSGDGDNIYWSEDYTALSYATDFLSFYKNGQYGVTMGKFALRVRLEGRISDHPLKVAFKMLPVADYETPEIHLPQEPVVIPAGAYEAEAEFTYIRPAQTGREYRAQIAIDYDASDVVPGTYERQLFTIFIADTFPWNLMSVASQEEWVSTYKPYLGDFGPEKLRFILSVVGETKLKSVTSWNRYGPAYTEYFINTVKGDIINALNKYNAEHPDAPVREADGTLVSFPE